jgi:methionyl-tRNA formyltransferase
MDEGLDTGPMLARRAIAITPDHTGGTLTHELAQVGAALLIETLPAWLTGIIQPQPQDNNLATLAPRLKKEQGEIDWTTPALEIERQVRAYTPWPGAFTNGPRGLIKVLAIAVSPDIKEPAGAEPGALFKAQGGIYVQTGQGVVRLITVQPAGKKEMTAEAMLHGQPELLGGRLGS